MQLESIHGIVIADSSRRALSTGCGGIHPVVVRCHPKGLGSVSHSAIGESRDGVVEGFDDGWKMAHMISYRIVAFQLLVWTWERCRSLRLVHRGRGELER